MLIKRYTLRFVIHTSLKCKLKLAIKIINFKAHYELKYAIEKCVRVGTLSLIVDIYFQMWIFWRIVGDEPFHVYIVLEYLWNLMENNRTL